MASAASRTSWSIFGNIRRAGMERLLAARRREIERLGEQALEGLLAPIRELLRSPRARLAHAIVAVFSRVVRDHG